MCRQFAASVFGHQLVVSIHEYILLLVVTSLECIVTLTTNNSNCFLDPICAVHLEMNRQYVASVFCIHLNFPNLICAVHFETSHQFLASDFGVLCSVDGVTILTCNP